MRYRSCANKFLYVLLILTLIVLCSPCLPRAWEIENYIPAWPFLYRNALDDKGKTDVFWPLYHHEWDNIRDKHIIRPWLFLSETNLDEDSRNLSLLWQLNKYSRKGDEYSLQIFPVYWRKNTKDIYYHHVWPFWGYTRKNSYIEYSSMYPLFRFGKDSVYNETNIHCLWPVYNYHRSPDYFSHRFIPFYWYTRSWGVVTPYYWFYTHSTKAHGIFPLWHSERGDNFKKDIILPVYFRERKDDTSKGIILPYYWKNSPTRKTKGIYPVWYSSRGDDFKSDLILPFYWHEQNKGKSKGILLSYYWNNSPSCKTKGVFPLWYSSRGNDTKTDLILPSYYYRKKPESSLRLILPLFGQWNSGTTHFKTIASLYLDYKKDDLKTRAGIPIYWLYHHGPFSFTSLFPVYYHFKNANKSSEFKYILPFYGSYVVDDFLEYHFILMPLYFKFENQKLQLKGWNVLWPLIHYEKSPNTFSARVLPFYWHIKDPDYRLTIGSPLYFSFASKNHTYTYLIPLYGKYTHDAYYKRLLFPPAYIDTRDSSIQLSRKDIFYPIFSKIDKKDTHKTRFIPFMYRYKDPVKHFTFASPALLPPYYFRYEKGDHKENHLVPFWGYTKKGTYTRRLMLPPAYINTRDPSIELSRKDIFYPIFTKIDKGDTHTTRLIPFFYRYKDPKKYLTFASPALLPPYYLRYEQGDNKSVHLWPFWGYTKKGPYEETSSIKPLIRFGKNSQTGDSLTQVFNYYCKKEDNTLLRKIYPFYMNSTSPDSNKTRILTYYKEKDSDSSLRSLYPVWIPMSDTLENILYEFFKDSPYEHLSDLSSYSLWMHKKSPASDINQILFYYHKKDAASSVRTLYTFWMPREDIGKEEYTSPDKLFPVPAPLWVHKKSDTKTKDASFILHNYERDKENDSTEFSLLWPVPEQIRAFEYQKKSDDLLKAKVLGKVVSYERLDHETKDFRILWRLVQKSNSPESSTFEINPLYSHKETEEKSYWAICGGLVGRTTNKEGEKNLQYLWVF
jgi:hypothetical protein